MPKAEERYSADELIVCATELLQCAGLSQDRARIVAEILVESEAFETGQPEW